MSKILSICFVSTHIPLLAFIGFTISESRWADHNTQIAFVVLLIATLCGTALALFALHAMLAPVDISRVALANYRNHGQLPHLPLHYQDAAGQLMREVDITVSRLDNALAELAREARIDPLTGIGNRRFLMEQAQRMSYAARHGGRSFAVAIIDVDKFKGINDRFGHTAGDNVLNGVAAIMQRVVGKEGIVGRLGGDEFCILLPDRPLSAAAAQLEAVRVAVEAADFEGVSARAVSLSIGLAEAERDRPETVTQLLKRADTQVYLSKESGRNRTSVDGTT
ncbi:GGDEF domain-containing protein [Ancylobacter sp. MQZ15Z-1]|uniref:diguanylate cyclase n=1 Tax=Ancylobacter mangrovi TaxID=2972472 RepID=A0A9X2PFP7_9HYPH|nr:GGDEF domain-containing protein [Ancylobacter mangrovi]MCS0496111.1 GGDEF domain-containing protein [Ancylobacter mangrovi]